MITKALFQYTMGLLLAAGLLITAGCGKSGERFMDDTSITAAVKTELLKDAVVEGMSINVDTLNGHVQLSGFVDTPQQKERAAEIARTVEGVREVTNNLAVEPAAVGAPGTETEADSASGEIEIEADLPEREERR